VNRARRATLVALAVIVAVYAVTWLSFPSGMSADADSISFPASLFASGLGQEETQTVLDRSDPDCAGAELPIIPLNCSTTDIPTGHRTVVVDDLKQRELLQSDRRSEELVAVDVGIPRHGREVGMTEVLGNEAGGTELLAEPGPQR
jgi:hypothetical protein